MSNSTLYRIGGIAVFLSVLLSFGAYAAPIFLAIGSLLFAVFIFALYRLFSGSAPTLSLVTAVVGIVGAVVLAVMVFASPAILPNNALSNIATWASWFLPPMAFGFLAYQHSNLGMSRTLGIIGILGGLGGLVNLIVTLAAGGDWSNPTNPALSPVIMGSYYVGMLITLVWLVWSGVVLLRGASKAQVATA